MARRHRSKRPRRSHQRQRTRRFRQRGGSEPVPDYAEWKKRVNDARAEFLKNNSSDVMTTPYSFAEFKKEAFALPPRKKDMKEGAREMIIDEQIFNMPIEYAPSDVRAIGSAIMGVMQPMFGEGGAEKFTTQDFIQKMLVAQQGEHAAANESSIALMQTIERSLRGDNEQPVINLADAKEFPLLIWYLVMNLPQESEEKDVPILGPPLAGAVADAVP